MPKTMHKDPEKKVPVKECGGEKTKRCFAAIDFETADYDPSSACALSMLRVEGKEIVEKRTYLIRPPRKRFVFSYLHGIEWQHVEKKPVFRELWPEVEPFFNDVEFIAAHNAGFDRNVLATCCADAGFTAPAVPYLCTIRVARKAWNIFPTKLPDVCKHLSIPLKHHDATSDAHACAQIVIRALTEKKELPNFMRPKRNAFY